MRAKVKFEANACPAAACGAHTKASTKAFSWIPVNPERRSRTRRISTSPSLTELNERERAGYLTSESILNIGRYMAMMITPTIRPTPIIISGSITLVSV